VAKHEKPATSKPSRMSVMILQFEGSDETMQEGFKTISQAIEKLASPSVRYLPVPSPRIGQTQKLADGEESPIIDADYVEPDQEANSEEVQQPKSSEGRKSQPKAPKVIDLDLKAGTVPLREFLEKKNPTTDSRKYICLAAWLKLNLSIDEVGIDHVYTVYRYMSWTSQRDVGAPLRSMKSTNGWFDKGKEKGTYRINHIGIDVAERTNGE